MSLSDKIKKIFREKNWIWIGEDDEINWDKTFIELEEEILKCL